MNTWTVLLWVYAVVAIVFAVVLGVGTEKAQKLSDEGEDSAELRTILRNADETSDRLGVTRAGAYAFAGLVWPLVLVAMIYNAGRPGDR